MHSIRIFSRNPSTAPFLQNSPRFQDLHNDSFDVIGIELSILGFDWITYQSKPKIRVVSPEFYVASEKTLAMRSLARSDFIRYADRGGETFPPQRSVSVTT